MNSWQKLSDRFDVLTRREQWLILVSGLIALLFVGFVLFVEPQMKALTSAKRQLVSVANDITSSTNQITLIERKLKADPNRDIEQQIDQLERQNTALDEQLQGRVASLVTPMQMSGLMEQVLQRSDRLKLVSLESQPSVQLISGEDEGYYIHPVRLTLRGRYFDVVSYLSQLESLPVKYYWRSLNYQVDKYPWADIQLDVYTLGESKDFIGG
ncbi:type 4a pilus biogenesis protein PilO [Photobacterium sp. SDRW27]|uniref:type II secretion system protein GspM n=1 Tax=Photobacterium obscurum TaxID=2829490 RepID=UPI002244E09F|nr:type II secretion system protein GspM [Photobacterium obscurum]MCW8330416.1 type 4a pilus biogenesis protein PilO [Photobacterium obscurum]